MVLQVGGFVRGSINREYQNLLTLLEWGWDDSENSTVRRSREVLLPADRGIEPWSPNHCVTTPPEVRLSAVWPVGPITTMSWIILDRCKSIFAALICPRSAAHDRGVRPSLSAVSGVASSRSRRIFSTASFPFPAAQESGIRPYLSLVLGFTCSSPP